MKKIDSKEKLCPPPRTPEIILYELTLLKKRKDSLVSKGFCIRDYFGRNFIQVGKSPWDGRSLNYITNYFSERLIEPIIKRGWKRNGNLWFETKDRTFVEFTKNFKREEDISEFMLLRLPRVHPMETIRKKKLHNISPEGQFIPQDYYPNGERFDYLFRIGLI